MNCITKHLDANLLTCKVHELDNAICAFSGKQINKGIKFADIIGKTFTELEILKYNSGWLSIDFALMTQPVIQGEKGLNSLRNYSFMATESTLTILDRQSLLSVLIGEKETPFQIAVTYSNKKHLAYKTPVNFNPNKFVVCTDLGNVMFDTEKASGILPIIQSWYTITKDTAQQPTYFTKDEILGFSFPQTSKIVEYGSARFFEENAKIEIHRNTSFFKLLVHSLNKTKHES